jgi:cysteine desulfurase
MSAPVYLDYNATAPLHPAAREAVSRALDVFGNPSSVHASGRRARSLVEDARDAVAQAIGAGAPDVIFTSGGTEANTLALRGLRRGPVYAGAADHPSVLAHIAADHIIPVGRAGALDLDVLEARLRAGPPGVVVVTAANNETGVLQPLEDVVALARRYDALVHCDAVQAFGKVPLAFETICVDSLALSAHKVGGLKGAGALVVRPGLTLSPDLLGGGQERRRRAGTENTVGIAAFGAAARQVPALLAAMSAVTARRDSLEARLRAHVPELQVFGAGAPRLGNTSCLGLAGLASETQLMAMDLAGVAISAGAACSSGKVAASHVLLAMGVPPELARCAIRISLGWDTSERDVARCADAWLQAARRTLAAVAGA